METTIGKRIAAARKQAGLTQDKLAEQLGITAQAVSKWENDLSCPDVTMLPRLAEIFGTTTDALLGMEREQVHEAQVVEEEDEGFRYQNDHVNIQFDAGRRGSLGFALWVLLTGAMLLANAILPQFGWIGPIFWPGTLSVWDIIWPVTLLTFGLVGLHPKFSFFRLGCALFGGYTLAGYFIGNFFNKEVRLPIIMVVLGLSLLVDALRKPKKSRFIVHNGNGKINQSSYDTDGERFTCATSFGGDKRIIDLPRLSGGEASVNFGELKVDLTACGEFAPGAALELNCSFGELDVRIPRTCRAEHTANTSFASVTVKGRPNDNASATIYLDCNASFGEIEIIYV